MIEKKLKVKRSSAGLGLFADDPIKKGEFIIEYKGEKISRKEADERGGRYLFEINSRFLIDGKGRDNIARYINHSCRPNSEMDIKKGKILLYSIRNIKSGDELSYDYGKEYVDEYIKPYGCRCIKCFVTRK